MVEESEKKTDKIFNEPAHSTVAIKSIWGVYQYVYGHNDIVSLWYKSIPRMLVERFKKSGLLNFEKDIKFSPDKEVEEIILANQKAQELFISSLRQELLFVDHIYVPAEEYSALLNEGIEELSVFHDTDAIKLVTLLSLSETEYSIDGENLVMKSRFSRDGYELDQVVRKSYTDLLDYQYCLIKLISDANEEDINVEYGVEKKKEILRKMKSWGIAKSTKKYLEIGNLNHDLQTRYWCQLAFDKYGVLPIPLVNTFSQYDNLPRANKGKEVEYQDVARLVLKKIPMPSPELPLDEFIDFRQSVEHKNSFYGLKRWMRKIAKSDINVLELEEELEYLISEYEAFMKLQKIKIETSSFQTVLTTGAEVIENLAKLNFSKAAQSAFDLKRRKVTLLEVERQAPGREVSYIVNSQKKLIDSI